MRHPVPASAFDGPARALTSAAGMFQAAALRGPSVAGVDARVLRAETERGPRGRGPLESASGARRGRLTATLA